MKKHSVLICLFFLTITLAGQGQSTRYIYYLDADLNTVAKSKAVILGKGVKANGLFKLDCYAITGDPLYLTLHFKDSTLTDIDGPYVSFYKNGRKEKEGNYVNNVKEGVWVQWDTLGRRTDSLVYKANKEMITATYRYYDNGKLSYQTYKDSLKDTYETRSFDKKDIVESEVFFKGQKGIWKRTTETGIKIDSLFTREEIEADFPGGAVGWRNFLIQNLDPNVPIDNKAPAGTYQVMVKFIIRPDGSVVDVIPETTLGYGMEREVVRLIKNGPKWLPAVQYGRKVNAYRRQPVTFVVSNE